MKDKDVTDMLDEFLVDFAEMYPKKDNKDNVIHVDFEV